MNRIHWVVCGLVCLSLWWWGQLTNLQAGERSSKTYLIIHADDAGMCHAENLGTIEAMEKGLVSSASIMVPCPWFLEIAEYARTHPDKDFGVHLTLNCEWKRYRWGPVAPKDQVSSLVDEQGYLWSNVQEVVKHAKKEEVRQELEAQVERALKFGVRVSHLDTHMGAVISRPDLLQVYVGLARKYHIPILFVRQLSEEQANEYGALAEHIQKLAAELQAQHLPVLDSVIQFYGGKGHEQRRENYLKAIRALKPGFHQLIVHCAVDCDELRAITNSASRRDSDRRIFTDPEVMKQIQATGVQIISWKELSRIQAASRQP